MVELIFSFALASLTVPILALGAARLIERTLFMED
jgi:hypothetical protein